MKKNVIYLLLGFLGFFVSSCSDDDDDTLPVSSAYRMAIFNEGDFQAGNASISIITPENEIENDVFEKVNNRPLGDVAQSGIIINNQLYVTLNNSAKIEVMDPISFLSIATILDEEKSITPIYMSPLSSGKAIVSDLYDNSMILVNTNTHAIEKKIDVNTATKQMVTSRNKVFIAANNKMLVMDFSKPESPRSITITDTDELWFNARLVKDEDGNVWMLTSKALTCVDANKETIVKEFVFAGSNIVSASWPQSFLDIDEEGDDLYLMATTNDKNALFKIDIDATSLPETPLFMLSSEVVTPYNMAVSPRGTIVVCDALDNKQSGLVFEFSQSGEKLHQWTAGINPQYILFSDK